MGSYLPKIRFETEFDGDQVEAYLTPLTRSSFLKTLSTMTEVDRSDKMAVLDAASEVLSEHVEEINGVRDANGNGVPKEVVLRDAHFMPLCLQILWHLMEKATMGKALSVALEEKSQGSSEAAR